MAGILERLFKGKPKYPRASRFEGHMYSADAGELGAKLDGWLGAGPSGGEAPSALIVPFGDHEYVGSVAGAAWAQARAHAASYKRVVVCGSAQRIPFRGPAIAGFDAWETPLGALRTDHGALNELMAMEQVRQMDEAHAQEASIELQAPFVQRALPRAELVPLLMGDGGAEELRGPLEWAWAPGTLLVVSTELSREEPLEGARARDARTAEAITGLDGAAIDRRAASARVPLRALLEVARARGARVEERARATSADVDGRAGQVVGYGAWALYG
jgi:hypothetical protein